MKKILLRKISAVTLTSLLILGLLVIKPVRAAEPVTNPLSYIWTYNPVVMYWTSVLSPLQNNWNNAQEVLPIVPYTNYSIGKHTPPTYTHNYSILRTKQVNIPTHTYTTLSATSTNVATQQYVPFSSNPTNTPTNSYVPVEKAVVNVPTNVYSSYTAKEVNVPTHTYESMKTKVVNDPTHTYENTAPATTNNPTHTYVDMPTSPINIATQQYVPFVQKPVNTPSNSYTSFAPKQVNVPTNEYVAFTSKKTNTPTNTYVPYKSNDMVENTSYSSWGSNGPTDFGSGAEALTAKRTFSSPLPPIFADNKGAKRLRGDQYSFDIEDSTPIYSPALPVEKNMTVHSLQTEGVDLGDVSEDALSKPLLRSDLARIILSVHKKNLQKNGTVFTFSKLPIIGDVKNGDPLYQVFVEVAARGLLYMPNTIVENNKLVYANAAPTDTAPVAQILQSYYKAVNKTPSTAVVYTYGDMSDQEWYAPYMYEAHAKQFLTPACTQRICRSGALSTISKQDALELLLKILQS